MSPRERRERLLQAVEVTDAVRIGLAYRATGWMNVVPANGKRPALAEWKHLEFAPPTEQEVREIWGGQRPPGFGLFLGGVVAAVDVDVRAELDGRDTMHELERRHGALPLSPRASSPSEGWHHFLAIPEGVDRARLPTKLGEGVALRHGRLFMALPPAPGREWEHDPEETPLAPLPQWIVDLGRVGDGAGRGTHAAPLELVPYGERHDYLWGFGVHQVRGGVVDEAVLLDHLLLEYARRCVQTPPRKPGGIEQMAHDLAHGPIGEHERVTMGFAARMLGYRRPGRERHEQHGDVPAGPFSLPVGEFVAAKHDAPPALLGTDDDCLLPARGLGMIVGRGGKGKTSLAVDLALHAAAGVDWLGIPIGRPLQVLLLENEGPREMFRRKLERRLVGWEHELGDRLHVHVQTWAGFKLEDAGVAELNRACDELAIDLVIGDPLDSLGMEGEGSPSEARRMVDRLKAAGLAERRAWLLLHHPRKANDVDAVDAASGDWGGRPDLMLRLDKLDGNRASLGFPKVRWAGRERQPFILDFNPDTGGFAFVCEGAEERDLAAEVAAYLNAHPLRTVKEIAAPADADEPGVGAREKAVRDVLAGDLFDSVTGEGAKAAGRHPTAELWKVRPAPGAPGAPTAPPGGASAAPEGGRDPVGVPLPGAPAPPPSPKGDPDLGAPEL